MIIPAEKTTCLRQKVIKEVQYNKLKICFGRQRPPPCVCMTFVTLHTTELLGCHSMKTTVVFPSHTILILFALNTPAVIVYKKTFTE
jgi:hypothetical protein